jgi:hypothetical protein
LRDAADRTEKALPADSTEHTLAAENAEKIEAIEPTEPTDKMEPAEPIDRIDPVEPMLKSDPADREPGESSFRPIFSPGQPLPLRPDEKATAMLDSALWRG